MGSGGKLLYSWNTGIKSVPKVKLYRGLRVKEDMENIIFPLLHQYHSDDVRSEDVTRTQK